MGAADAQQIQADRVTAPANGEDARAFAVAVARIADQHKTDNVSVLDLRGLTNLADYFVIGTGSSSRQMHAVVEYIVSYAERLGRRPFNISDCSDASWLLLDYVDVVVHLFDEQHRNYYDLDGLWGDAPQVRWQPDDGSEPASPGREG